MSTDTQPATATDSRASPPARARGAGGTRSTVTDNRTGQDYELAIEDGTVRATDLRQIKADPRRIRSDGL